MGEEGFTHGITPAQIKRIRELKKEMYLVMFHDLNVESYSHESTDYKASDTSLVSLLLSVKNNRIDIVDTLNYDRRLNNSVTFVINHDEYDFITIGEYEKDKSHFREEFLANGKNYKFKGYFAILDYSNENIIKRKAEPRLLTPRHGISGINSGYIIRDTFK